MIVRYTTIIHEFRKKHDISNNEYVLADIIDFLSSSRKYGKGSYVDISREELSEEFGASKRGIIYMINRLVKKGLVEKEEKTGRVRSTEKWQEVRENTQGSAVQKVHRDDDEAVQKVHRFGAKSAPKNDIIPYSIRIKDTICSFRTKECVFDSFMQLYEKKNDRARAKKKFLKIPENLYQKIFDAVPLYVRSTPDIKYRKNAVTWLNAEGWDDEFANGQPNIFSSQTSTVKPLENNSW